MREMRLRNVNTGINIFQCLDLILKSKEGKNTIDTDIDMIQARDIFKTCWQNFYMLLALVVLLNSSPDISVCRVSLIQYLMFSSETD